MPAPRNGSPGASDEHPMTLATPIRLPRPMVLAFHEIVGERFSGLYKLSTAQFEDYLHVVQELCKETSPNSPSIRITFDDGHISNYHLALPLLGRHRVRAMFFVTGGSIGGSTQHMRGSHLKQLAASGHEVQSNAWSHRGLTDCSQHPLEEELLRARETLEENLAFPARKIAIPYGRYNVRVLKACTAAGYEQVYTSDPWMGFHLRWGVRVCRRLSVRSTLGPVELRRLLTLKAFPYLYQRTKSRGKEVIKTLLGDNFYKCL